MATQPVPAPEPRIPLSRDRILRAALALADEGGIESLTMRRLGQELGYEAMSLYNHVANKDDVLLGILELVLEETELPSTEEPWDTSIRRSAISVYNALRRHPWAVNLLMSPDRVLVRRLEYMDRLLGVLREAGFSPETTYHAYHALDAHITGFSLWAASHTLRKEDLPGLAADFMRKFPLDDYPDLLEHFHQHMAEGAHHNVTAFEFSLDLILDGLRKIHDA
jgi:AcrR family transcriptional regulator